MSYIYHNLLKDYIMKTIFVVLGFLISIINISSQVQQEWVARYHPSILRGDYAFDMVLDDQGNIYVVGKTQISGQDDNWAIIKYDPAGTLIWDIIYNGPANYEDEAVAVTISNDLNCLFVTGGIRLPNAGPRSIVTKKITFSGTELWSRIYNSIDDRAYKIVVSNYGNVFVSGYSANSALLIKYSQDGDSIWTRKYNHNNAFNREFFDMAVDSSEFIYVTSASDSNIITTKFNSNGGIVWENSYTGPGDENDEPYAIDIDPSGNVYVAGQIRVNGFYNFITISYSNSGVFRWERIFTYPANGDDAAQDMCTDNLGNIYVTGYIDAGTSHNNFLTVKFNSSGNILWQKEFNNSFNQWDIAESITIDNEYNVYVTGRSGRPPYPYFADYNTIKYSPEGILLWSINYNAYPSINQEDIPQKVLVDNYNNVYVTGWSKWIYGFDICTIKYSQPIGLKQVSVEIPSSFQLLQNYPNPFNPVTNIEFGIPVHSYVKIIIYDAVGSKIDEIVNSRLNAGTYMVDWNGGNFASGIYYYQLTTESYRETKKMVLIK